MNTETAAEREVSGDAEVAMDPDDFAIDRGWHQT